MKRAHKKTAAHRVQEWAAAKNLLAKGFCHKIYKIHNSNRHRNLETKRRNIKQ